MRVSVIGAGKMGLPLGCQFAKSGATVIACDVNTEVVNAINQGKCLIDEPGVPELVSEMVAAGRLSASTDTTEAASKSDVIVVIVPAVLTPERRIDLSILESVSRQIAKGLKPGAMVSYETTVFVGCTRSRMIPILEESGLKAGKDFDVTFSPERVKSQHVLRNLTRNPKIVGGLNEQSTGRGVDFYKKYLGAEVIRLESLEHAEFAKLLGMIYRDANIALSNELARYAEVIGVDIYPVIQAANTDGEAYLLQPGIGVGGHCTPVYPYFLIHDAAARGVPATLSERARRVNDQQCGYVLDRLQREWQDLKNRRVLILGLGFRPQVKEHIHSTAFLLREELCFRGAEVTLHDPLYSDDEIRAHGFTPGSVSSGKLPEVLVLNTGHNEYGSLDFAEMKTRGVKAVVDGRNFWNPEAVRKSGITYVGVGHPSIGGSGDSPFDIPVARPVLDFDEVDAVSEVIRSGWVMQGPQVKEFERDFGRFVGAPYACAVSSGTSALHLALRAVGVGSGDEVITVSHSFIATANVVRYCGAVPVFVDIDPKTFNMDPAKIESAMTPKTRAILCVHQIGMPCDLKAILEIGRKRGIPVVEDAACAIGSEIEWEGKWERIGKPHADIACFSFHPRKIITTGEGGMITTSDRELDAKIRAWRQLGMTAPEQFADLGYNYRMTDMQAAMGRQQLARLSAILRERAGQVERYRNLFSGIQGKYGERGFFLPEAPSWARSNWQSFCIRLPEQVSQRMVLDEMAKRGISVRGGVMCAHRVPPYSNGTAECRVHGNLRFSEEAQDRSLIIPLFPRMTLEQQERVVKSLEEIWAG